MHPALTSQLAQARRNDLLRPAAPRTRTLRDRLLAVRSR